MAYYLRIGSDCLDQAERHSTLGDAKAEFLCSARELAMFGQPLEASVHIGKRKSELDEYPDYVLSLGPRGGLRCERT